MTSPFQSHFQIITSKVPSLEPLLFVLPFKLVPDDEYAKLVGPNAPQTACCSPNGFFFQSSFWASLPKNKQCGLIIHEVLHGALCHLSDPWQDRSLTRASFRQLRNISQDIAIENLIYDVTKQIETSRPEDTRSIYPNYDLKRFLPYANLTWRQVYARLLSENPPSQGQGPSGWGEEFDSHGNPEDYNSDDAKSEELTKRWERAQEESKSIEKNIQAGNQAGGASIDVTPDVPTVPWQQLLVEYLTTIPAPVRLTWAKVKRRPFAVRQEYIPDRTGTITSLGRINVLLDTSGSMSGDYNAIAGEVLSICAMAKSVYRVDYDVGVAYKEYIEHPEDYELASVHGGGGTCIRTTMEQLIDDPDFDRKAPTVVLSDSGDSYDVADFGVPMVFITYGGMFRSDAGPVFQVQR